MTLQEKEVFYGQIDLLNASLDGDDDDLDDDPRHQSRSFFEQSTPGKRPSRPSRVRIKNVSEMSAKNTAVPEPEASTGDPTPVADVTPIVAEPTRLAPQTNRQSIPISTSFIQDAPLQHSKTLTLASLRRSLTEPTSRFPEQLPSAMASTSARKRTAKGKNKETAVPEERQILRGMSLFYIRSDRVALKRQRMEHAERHGAIVTDQLSDATHVVVDEDLKYDDIKATISAGLVNESCKVVKDQWPLDCIHQGRIFPAYPRYRIRGMPTEEKLRASARQGEKSDQPGEVPATQTSDKSLELKAPTRNTKRWNYVPQQTPPQSDTPSLPSTTRGEGSDVMDPQRPPNHGASERGGIVALSDVGKEGQTDPGQTPQMLTRPDSAFGDELSQVLNKVREQFKDLPPIDEEDAVLSLGEDGEEDDSDTADENEKKRTKTGPKSKGKKKNFEEYFACNRGGTKEQSSNQDNPNAQTIAVLKQMLEYYTQTNDYWRTFAYRKCIGILSKITDRKITTAEEAIKLPWFGTRLSSKLEEIVRTHTLARLTYALSDPTSRVLALFLGIYGVGNTTADNWIARGFRTLDDLRRRAELTDAQRVGIDHYNDLNTRIPRAEVARLAGFVAAEAASMDADVKLIIGGSYRRGADSSGDVDLIITKRGTASSGELVPFLDRLVSSLERQGFLTAALASSSPSSKGGGSKWHGCCVLPRIPGYNDDEGYRPVWRRIDLLLVPETEYGAALIYFTGNDIFNRSIRLLASRKGMRLNQRGLYKDALRGYNRQKVSEGELLEGRSEKRIFQILGVKWREPEQRWC